MDYWLERFHPKDVQRMEDDYRDLQNQASAEFQHEYRICHEDGSWRWILSRGSTVRNAGGRIVRMTGSISDITEKKSIDPLTALHNRTSFLEGLEHRIAKPIVSQKSFSVLLIGIHRFKQINDSFGQTGGDAVLIEIARRLQATLENDDLSIAARIGSHEFVVLLERVAAIEDAVTYANHLQLLLESPMECNGQLVTISTSIGIAMGDEGYSTSEKMLEDASVAMHQAEKSRQAKCIVFGAHMRERARRRVEIETDLHAATPGHQLLPALSAQGGAAHRQNHRL